MTGFSKLPLALAVASAVLLSGCLGGGGGGSSSSGSPATTTTVEGTAAKGIVLGGVVKAYEFGSDTVVAETTTDETDGSYQLALPDTYNGTPLRIEVSAVDGTLMRCDIKICQADAAGNAVISFGDDYPLAEDFKLLAVIPGTTESTVEVNVTPLTTVAAELAQERILRGIDAREAVSGANNQIALSFKIAGDLTTLPVVDVTLIDPDSIAAADIDSLSGVAAVQAMQQSGLTPEAALSELLKDLIRTDGNVAHAADPAKPGALSLESVYKQALVLIEEIEAKAEKEQVDLGNSLSGAKTALKSAEKEASTGSTEPKPVEPKDPGSEGLQATKQFVQQLRDLTNTATLEENLQGFAEEVEMVSQVAGPDLKASLSAMGMALRAIAEAEEARQNGVTDTRFDFDGVVVNRTGKVYDVKQALVVNGLDINVDIKADVTYESNIADTESETDGVDGVKGGEYQTKGDIEIRIAVSGTAASSAARVVIENGSLIDAIGSIDVTGKWEDKWVGYDTGGYDYSYEWGYDDAEQGVIVLNGLDTVLVVKLEQLSTATVADPMSFTGKLDLDVNDFALTRTYNEVHSGSDSYVWADARYAYQNKFEADSELDIKFAGLALTVSGEFKNSVDSLYASASLQADNFRFSESCYAYDEYKSGSDGYSWDYHDDCSVGEDVSGNVKLALNFDLNLVGMNDPISVAVNARNQGLDAVIGDARLIYGGQSLKLEYAGANSVTVKNHNDVLLTLEEAQVSGDEVLTGDIQWKGKKYATVDMELGAPRIRYSDGTFEVL